MHLYRADQSPVSSAVERIEVVDAEMWGFRGGRWVNLLEGMWGLCENFPVFLRHCSKRVHWVLILSSCLNQCSVALGSTSRLLYLSWCSVHLVCQELDGGATAAACFGCEDSEIYLRNFVVSVWEAVGILQMLIFLCRHSRFAPSKIIFVYWYPCFPLPCFRVPFPCWMPTSAFICCSCKSCAGMEVIQKLDKTRILLMEIGCSNWNEVGEK